MLIGKRLFCATPARSIGGLYPDTSFADKIHPGLSGEGSGAYRPLGIETLIGDILDYVLRFHPTVTLGILKKDGPHCVRILPTTVNRDQHLNSRIPARLIFRRQGLFWPPEIARFFSSIKTSLWNFQIFLRVKTNYITCTARSGSLHFRRTFALKDFSRKMTSFDAKSLRMVFADDFLIGIWPIIPIGPTHFLQTKFIGGRSLTPVRKSQIRLIFYYNFRLPL